MEKHNFVTIADLTKEKILYMIEMAEEFEKHPNRELLKGKVVATLFFEPSTRTRLSFETAANRLGARVIGFADPKITSGTKGETLKDTILMVSNYADVIVMRHYIEGAAQYASEVAPIPIVNAGDGAHQHPSQCMLDLYSIYKTQGTLENLNIYMVGDLKYGRTVHSLLMAMRHFNPTFHFVAPKELAMPNEYKLYCKEHGIKYQEHTAFNDKIIADADILYMTRVQKERFSDLMEYERVKNVYVLNNELLKSAKPNMKMPTISSKLATDCLPVRPSSAMCWVSVLTKLRTIKPLSYEQERTLGCRHRTRHCDRPYTCQQDVSGSQSAGTFRFEDTCHHRFQLPFPESGQQGNHQGERQVLYRRRNLTPLRSGPECDSEYHPRL